MEGYSTGDVLAFTGKDKWDSKRFFTTSEGVNLGQGSIFGLAPFGNIYTYTGDAKDFSLENHYGGESLSLSYTFPIPFANASLILTVPYKEQKYNTYGIGITPGYNM
ncbi:hypothetical protein EI427_21570 [Flammeovirga pectinis]|uniref:Uncharacterized protein n=1 Tax=Flammeovirga pectinis TaxID=2494373 RepID=A0A3S9P9G1_9BACT|nr:hypothetical protein [Flammeovirga pectinis]AZQ64817.1 hypothetical protein EI427_21570 [Flammeovirga pectinis]